MILKQFILFACALLVSAEGKIQTLEECLAKFEDIEGRLQKLESETKG